MSDPPKPEALHRSLRTQVRMGGLRRSERPDPAGELDAREPEELFEIDKANDASAASEKD